MIVIRERQVLDVVIQSVADVVTDMSADPFGDIALETVQGRGQQAKTEQQQSRTDQHAGVAADNTLVDHLLDDTRHEQGKSGQGCQGEQAKQDLSQVRSDKGAESEY